MEIEDGKTKKEKQGRYKTSGMIEDEYMPGSEGQVLRNLLGISSSKEIERVETELLYETTDTILDDFDKNLQYTAEYLCWMHRNWLGSIYEWAGRYRNVMISKGDFPFAAPAFIPKLMEEFEKEILFKYTPCIFDSDEEIVSALAIVHTELVLIHPFREGNGRISRLLSMLMALQAGLPYLDFESMKGDGRKKYFAAVRYGLDRNYRPMEKIFSDIIDRSRKAYGE